MANIFVNLFKATAGGGKMILDNYIKHLFESELEHNYFVLTPNRYEYVQYQKNKLFIVDVPKIFRLNLLFPLLYFYKFPKLLKQFRIDLIFNFGDVIIPTKTKQIYFFDWAYAVYKEKYIWNKMEFSEKIIRKVKVFLINKFIDKVSLVLAQTKNIKDRLDTAFNIKETIVIPTPISLKPSECESLSFFETFAYKLFYPASFSFHKNHSVLLNVAEIIKSRNLSYNIYITIKDKNFEDVIEKKGLENQIINLGTLNREQMNCAYQECDAVIMPTLLETYGFPFYEAMAYEKPIFTSDLDFAKDACGEAAVYFNPFEAVSIVNTINGTIENKELLSGMKVAGRKIIEKIPTWYKVMEQFNECINQVLNKEIK